jgi:hypothetical protein
MQATALFDCFEFDALPSLQNGWASAEVDVGWCEIVQALVISALVVVGHELADVGIHDGAAVAPSRLRNAQGGYGPRALVYDQASLAGMSCAGAAS